MKDEKREGRWRLKWRKEELEEEAKRKAGEKKEKGRDMKNKEREKVEANRERCDLHIGEVSKWMNSESQPQRVGYGVLVQTNGPWVLVGIPLGKIQISDAVVLAISAEAPVAQAWQGAKVGDAVQLGPQTHIIEGLY